MLFALFACLVFAAYVLDSRWFFEWEGKTPVMQRVYYSLAAFIPMSGFAFFGKWLQGTLSRITVSLSLTHGALGVFVLCAPYSWAALANLPWLLANVACYTFVLTWSFRAWRQNRGERLEQLPILTGTILSSTCFCLDSFSLGQQWLYGSFALTGMALYVLCGAVALVLRYRRLQDRVKQVTGMILSAHEDERKRVARDLHDGVGQLLQAVKLGLSMLNGQARAGQTVSSTSLTELVDETSQAIEEVRRVSMDLRPAFLERQGLIEAIQWYARRIAERTAIEVEVSCDELPPLTEKLRDHLYRIFQEALNNVVAHAAAQIIQVRLACSPTHLTLTIQDNGRGFSPSTSSARGVGLTSMRERIEILSGQMSVDSRLGKGTTLIFRVPVDHPR